MLLIFEQLKVEICKLFFVTCIVETMIVLAIFIFVLIGSMRAVMSHSADVVDV